jgi:DEAD/DEAH box helicase domain-containing protein
MNKIVLDLETKKSFDEVGGFNKQDLLGISVVGIYDYAQNKYIIYREDNLDELQDLLKGALIIGFNIKHFDFEVMKPYFKELDLDKVEYIDMMKDFEKHAGHRIKLEDLAQKNLGKGKSGSGLDALKYYKEGKWEKLEKYCLDDVRVTKAIYDLGLKQGYLKYKSKYEDDDLAVPAEWARKVTSGEVLSAFAKSHISRKPIEIEYLSKIVTEGDKHLKRRKIQVENFVNGGVEAFCFLTNERRHFLPDRVLNIF